MATSDSLRQLPVHNPKTLVTRRHWLAGLASCTALLRWAPAAAQAASRELTAFLALSAALTGRTALDRKAGARLLQLTRRRVGEDALSRLLRFPGSAGEPARGLLENQIVADWYSGATMAGGSLVIFDPAGALMWQALDFTKPAGVCGGSTGHWSAPPLTPT